MSNLKNKSISNLIELSLIKARRAQIHTIVNETIEGACDDPDHDDCSYCSSGNRELDTKILGITMQDNAKNSDFTGDEERYGRGYYINTMDCTLLDVNLNKKYYLLVCEYDSGDSFGSTTGNLEFIDLYDAEKDFHLEAINELKKKDDYAVITYANGGKHKISTPWSDYFCQLQAVLLYTIERGKCVGYEYL